MSKFERPLRVLVTGMTGLQLGRPGRRGVQGLGSTITPMLRDAGHEVDHVAPTPATSVDGYDVVMVGMASPTQLPSSHTFGAITVIGRAQYAGVPVVCWVDDWALHRARDGFKEVAVNHPENLTKPRFSDRPGYAWALDNKTWLTSVVERLYHDGWPVTLVPAFTWGDHVALAGRVPAVGIVPVDPSRYLTFLPESQAVERTRQWLSPHLTGNVKWLKGKALTWPVREFTGQREGFTPESVVVQLYGTSWGTVALPYTNGMAGTGWFRNRFPFATRQGTVILGDRVDVRELSDAFTLPARSIEVMTDPQLRDLAAAQRDVLLAREATREQVRDVINRLLADPTRPAITATAASKPTAREVANGAVTPSLPGTADQPSNNRKPTACWRYVELVERDGRPLADLKDHLWNQLGAPQGRSLAVTHIAIRPVDRTAGYPVTPAHLRLVVRYTAIGANKADIVRQLDSTILRGGFRAEWKCIRPLSPDERASVDTEAV